jgi:hypothetical protein
VAEPIELFGGPLDGKRLSVESPCRELIFPAPAEQFRVPTAAEWESLQFRKPRRVCYAATRYRTRDGRSVYLYLG